MNVPFVPGRSTPRVFAFLAVLLVIPCIGTMVGAQTLGTLGLVVHKTEGFHNNFWDALQMGARMEAERLGYRLDYRGVPTSSESDRTAGQIRIMEDMADAGYKGILLTPLDRFRLASAVRYAVVRGIPVVSVDSPVESNLLSGIVATNNYESGMTAARYFFSLLGPRATVIMLAHPSRENKATRDREQAFLVAAREFAPQVRILSSERHGDASIEGDYQAALALLDEHPTVEGVYTINGTGLAGFLKALQERGRAGKVKLVGWDADQATIGGLRAGTVHGIVQQDPQRMGMEAVRLLHSAITGEAARINVDTGVTIVTRDNLDSPRVRALISPDFGPWVR